MREGSPLRLALKNGQFVAGVVIFLSVLLVAAFAPQLALRPYDAMDLAQRLSPPGSGYPLGTDEFGRCLASRIIYGARIALRVGLIVVTVETIIGVTLGLVAGYYGGWADRVISFVTDVTWSLPPIVLALAIVTVLGPSLNNVMIAIAAVSWGGYARLIRAKTQGLKNMPFVEAALAVGETNFSIMFRYILPNTLGVVIVLGTLSLPGAILSTTALSFLGLGSQPPDPDWGVILNRGLRHLHEAAWVSIFPGLALVWTALGFNLLGEGLRDLLDPQLKA
ncbi:MAG TPA: glutathione ABC transporter permease GsiD [Clostridiales bacterium]|nr:glutathione ABC transporter permease GsiD [Clostridiales bacterium]